MLGDAGGCRGMPHPLPQKSGQARIQDQGGLLKYCRLEIPFVSYLGRTIGFRGRQGLVESPMTFPAWRGVLASPCLIDHDYLLQFSAACPSICAQNNASIPAGEVG